MTSLSRYWSEAAQTYLKCDCRLWARAMFLLLPTHITLIVSIWECEMYVNILGWNPASDAEAGWMYFRRGGHRGENASELYYTWNIPIET